MRLEANKLRFTAVAAGPPAGPVVLLLHGFPDHPNSFRHQMEPLAEAGFRVIAPTMRGYEPSCQPDDGDYSAMTLADDVAGWLDNLGVERAHIIGHDWGAVAAYTFGAHHGDRAATVTALAIPPISRISDAVPKVPRQMLLSWYMTFFQLPAIAEWSLRARDRALIRWLWRRWSPNYHMNPGEWAELDAVFATPGVVEGALAYYRQNATPALFLGLRTNPAMETGTIAAPTLIMHGSDDGCMDQRLFDRCIEPADFPAGVRHEVIDRTGHFLHLEAPELVNPILLDHLGNSRS